MSDTRSGVFLDPSGRRWRRLRRVALVAGVATTLLAATIVAAIFVPPLLPAWRGDRSVAHLPVPLTSRQAREREAARRRLFAALGPRRPPPALRPSRLPLHGRRASERTSAADELTVGFYVNWDDNSFTSFSRHAALMDWVVCEWAFVAGRGDSLRFTPDPRVLYVAQRLPAAERPLVFAMVSNFNPATQDFDPQALRRLVARPGARARAIAQLDSFVARYGLGGITVDFENVPDSLNPAVLAFVREARARLHPRHALVTQTLPADLDPVWLRRYAQANDKIFLMLYDEHYGKGDAGPVASQGWYLDHVRRAAALVPPNRLIFAIGAYGYDWNDAGPQASGDELTFQDAMAAARTHGARVSFDSVSLNPWVSWTDSDSTDHVAWFLDAATAYNQMLAGSAAGAAGRAIWRLGSEDPTIWKLLADSVPPDPRTALSEIRPGYDVQFDGNGEILRITAKPTLGRRIIRLDSVTRFIDGEHYTGYPSPWVVSREGNVPHKVALTFDDGPDGRWTPAILDTLRSRGVHGTFFVIGENVEAHMGLMRRIVREGNEFGNHTFTHPNLALVSPLVTRLELDATERLLEAVTNRRSAFFRPPYFGDAEPTTADELVPVGIASDLGYVTAGLHLDSEDWEEPGDDAIIRNVLEPKQPGHVVLLHDGGGDRHQTVAVLGRLIDSLRARGDTIVQLSELAGIPYDEAIAPLPPQSMVARALAIASWGLAGIAEWILYWIFLVAVVLGLARLAGIIVMAVGQRIAARRSRAPADYAPPVSVVVPAYKEARVIASTVASLLAQEYPGPVEIIVVDDGSPDDTWEVACAAYGTHPQVRIFRQANGGKASALNRGIAEATGEVIVALDADTVFGPGTLAALVAPMADPAVGAVAGNAKVGNRINLVTRWQALEYVTSQNLDRRALSLINGITVVPGAVGAWRRSVIADLGGFSSDTLAEDQDLTIAVRRAGHVIAYADGAVAWTEAPDTFRGLARQRFRWSFGTLQCMWKHRAALLRPREGSLGMVAMPHTWIFQLLFPAVSPIADLLFAWSLVSVALVRYQHGDTYAVTNLEQVLTYYGVFLLVDWLGSVFAFLLEPGEDRSLTWLVFLQRFAYRQVMYWVVVRSFVAAVRGGLVGWGKLERKATVRVPVTGQAEARP